MSREERRRDAGQRYGFGLFESPPCSAGHKQINMHSHPHWAGQEREREREGEREKRGREKPAVAIASQCEANESSLNFKDQMKACSDKAPL